MKRLLCIAASLAMFASCAEKSKDYSISYVVGFEPEAHYIDVEMTFVPGASGPVAFHMPVWAPGYYEIVNYPVNVCYLSATNTAGEELSIEKSGKSCWIVDPAGADTLKVNYKVYANQHSVAESRVTAEDAFVATNGVFMYVDVNHPVEVQYVLPEGWNRISTGADYDSERGVYTYTDFDVLYDQPLLLGNQRVIEYEQDGYQYELAFETPDGIDECSFVEDFKKMTHTAAEIIGGVPYEKYCLIHLGAGGGGLEHTNSQAYYTKGSYRFNDRLDYLDHLMFTTHEYFHLYNVKTIRPIELGPFDYEKENFTNLLWFSEGITCYYETKILLEAGLISQEERLAELSKFIRDTEMHEGHRNQSMKQFSYDIWLNFMNWGGNSKDVTISYYVKGPVLGLLYDCFIINATNGERSLDDFMRLLYHKYYEEQGRGFTEAEFWSDLEAVAGCDISLLRTYAETTVDLDYDSILNPAGLALDHETWKLSEL